MKGMSPLLAVVLLIAFIVSFSILIMGWMATVEREQWQYEWECVEWEETEYGFWLSDENGTKIHQEICYDNVKGIAYNCLCTKEIYTRVR